MGNPRRRGGGAQTVMAELSRAQRGLYGGKTRLFGNQKSHSMVHTRRSWKPNVQPKRLWSEALNQRIRVKVTTHVLRTIDFHGGLDNYLLNTSDSKIDSRFGLQLKAAVKRAREKAQAKQ